jgi:hypothetical protein
MHDSILFVLHGMTCTIKLIWRTRVFLTLNVGQFVSAENECWWHGNSFLDGILFISILFISQYSFHNLFLFSIIFLLITLYTSFILSANSDVLPSMQHCAFIGLITCPSLLWVRIPERRWFYSGIRSCLK